MLKALIPAAALPAVALAANPAAAATTVRGPATPLHTAPATPVLTALVPHGSHPNIAAVPVSGGFAVYGGYMDTHHHGSSNAKPSPWQGDPNVVFVGSPDTSADGWDSSAVRVDNLSQAPEQVDVTVDIGRNHYDLWGPQTVPPGQSLVLAQTTPGDFDGSDTNPAGGWGADPQLCQTSVSPTVPVVRVTVDGVTTDVHDSAQLLNTGGVDAAGCPYTGARDDESEPWTRMW